MSHESLLSVRSRQPQTVKEALLMSTTFVGTTTRSRGRIEAMARSVTGVGIASHGEVGEVYRENVIWEEPPDA